MRLNQRSRRLLLTRKDIQGGSCPAGGSGVRRRIRRAEETPTVEMPLDKQQLIGVKTVEVLSRPLQKIIRTVGRIEYDESGLPRSIRSLKAGSKSSMLITPAGM